MNTEKIVKVAGVLDTIAKIAGGILKACGIVCIIFAVLVLIFGEKMFVEGSVTLDLDFIKLYLGEQYQVIPAMIKLYAVVGLLVGGVLCFMMSYIAKLARNILAPMKEGRPFEQGVSENLKKIAVAILIGGAVSELLGVAERIIMTKAYPMEEIFASEAISKLEYVFTYDLDFVFTAVIVLFASYIFSYGQVLQQESDETL